MNETRVVIENEAELTKSDKMIYVEMRKSFHFTKIGRAIKDLKGNKFSCVVWELQDQIS